MPVPQRAPIRQKSILGPGCVPVSQVDIGNTDSEASFSNCPKPLGRRRTNTDPFLPLLSDKVSSDVNLAPNTERLLKEQNNQPYDGLRGRLATWGPCRLAQEVPPEAMAQLYELHEAAKSKQDDDEDASEDMSDSALDAAWANGEWHLFGKLPSGLRGLFGEAELDPRSLVMLPQTVEPPVKLLACCGVACINATGCKGSANFGQDNLSVSRLPDGWEAYCVFDGHGEHGHLVAERVARVLPYFLRGRACSSMLRAGQVQAALVYAFEKADADLVSFAKQHQVKLKRSGTTAVCALRKHGTNKAWVAHAGDTRAVLFSPALGATRCTVDHNPSVPEERRRVQEVGGKIWSRRHRDGFLEERVWDPAYGCGLCVTRSLGDVCLKPCGVSSKPEVAEWPLEPGQFLLIGTDGLWDMLTTKQATDFVIRNINEGKSPQATLDDLVTKVQAIWLSEEQQYCDDVTVLLMSVDGPGLLAVAGGQQRQSGPWPTAGCYFSCVSRSCCKS